MVGDCERSLGSTPPGPPPPGWTNSPGASRRSRRSRRSSSRRRRRRRSCSPCPSYQTIRQLSVQRQSTSTTSYWPAQDTPPEDTYIQDTPPRDTPTQDTPLGCRLGIYCVPWTEVKGIFYIFNDLIFCYTVPYICIYCLYNIHVNNK